MEYLAFFTNQRTCMIDLIRNPFRLSAATLGTDSLYLHETSQLLCPVKGRIDSRIIAYPEESGQLKIPMIPGIEPAAIRFVEHCLNELRPRAVTLCNKVHFN